MGGSMPSKPALSKVGLIKSYLLPVLITFLIPGFALWFFEHVESSYDQKIRKSVISQIQGDQRMTEAQRQTAIKLYKSIVVSRVLASNDPKAKPLQDSFANVQTRYAIFRWMKRIALVCLVSGIGAFVAV